MADNDDNKPNKLSHPHDSMVRKVFGDIEHAKGELLSVLPDKLVDAIDWDTLAVLPTTTISPELHKRDTDFLYKCTLRGHPTYLRIILEAQQDVDKTMCIRQMVNMGRVWDEWLRDVRKAKKEKEPIPWPPPLVLAITLYHGNGKWNYSTQFADSFDLDPETAEVVAPFFASF